MTTCSAENANHVDVPHCCDSKTATTIRPNSIGTKTERKVALINFQLGFHISFDFNSGWKRKKKNVTILGDSIVPANQNLMTGSAKPVVVAIAVSCKLQLTTNIQPQYVIIDFQETDAGTMMCLVK